MDPQKKLEKIFFDLDPMKLHSPVDSEYSTEAKQICKEMQYVMSPEKLAMILYNCFAKQFSPKEATIDWKPIVSAILKDETLKKMLGRLL